MEKADIKDLKKRYLIWLYKTTKESLDRIERKFTQLSIDKFLLKELKRHRSKKEIGKFIDEFSLYIENKEKEGLNLKFEDKAFHPQYSFLVFKLKAIEKAIVKVLGRAGLKEIKSLYEKEMIERILKSTDHK
ncbi:MAG: hypothetical protein AB1629_02020 [Candidatus Omnitrophota bacterium]